MRLFKSEENADIAKTLGTIAQSYSELGQVQKAMEINEKVYGRELSPFPN